MTSLTVPALAGETVDALVWRATGAGSGAVEATLEANPGLAEYGATLPEGLAVRVPVLSTPASSAPIVNLWD